MLNKQCFPNYFHNFLDSFQVCSSPPATPPPATARTTATRCTSRASPPTPPARIAALRVRSPSRGGARGCRPGIHAIGIAHGAREQLLGAGDLSPAAATCRPATITDALRLVSS